MSNRALKAVEQIGRIIKRANRIQRILKTNTTYFFEYKGNRHIHKLSVGESDAHQYGYQSDYTFVRYQNVSTVGLSEIQHHPSKYRRYAIVLEAIESSKEFNLEELYNVIELLYETIQARYNHKSKSKKVKDLLGDDFDDL